MLLITALGLATSIAGALFGGGTLRALADVRTELARRKASNDLLAAGNRALRNEVDALAADSLVLEKAIRDELSYIDDGEVIILFDPPGPKPRLKTAEGPSRRHAEAP